MSISRILAEIKEKESDLELAKLMCDDACQEYKEYEKIWTSKENSKGAKGWIIGGIISSILAVCLTIIYLNHLGQVTLGSLIVIGLIWIVLGFPLLAGLGMNMETSDYKKGLERFGGEEAAQKKTEVALKKWQEHEKECEQLTEELKELRDKFSAAKKELKGKYWELSEFKATPKNIKAMEQDVEKLFQYLEYVDDPKEAISNWICRARMEHFNAVMNKDEATQKAQDTGLTEMNNSGSWKLEIVATVLLYMDMAIMSAAFGGEMQGGLDWLASRSETLREAETEDEKQFYELAKNACDTMSAGVRHVLRKELEGKVSYY